MCEGGTCTRGVGCDVWEGGSMLSVGCDVWEGGTCTRGVGCDV